MGGKLDHYRNGMRPYTGFFVTILYAVVKVRGFSPPASTLSPPAEIWA